MEIHFGWSWKVMENDFLKRVVTLITATNHDHDHDHDGHSNQNVKN